MTVSGTGFERQNKFLFLLWSRLSFKLPWALVVLLLEFDLVVQRWRSGE